MTGLVLCGGQSLRMGKDKGLLLEKNETFAAIAFRKLKPLCEKLLVSINENQLEAYLKRFDRHQLVIDDTNLHIRGPLLGLMSAFQQNPEADLLVLACDLIDMENAALENLLANYRQNPEVDFYVYQNEIQNEPLCGIYKAKGLQKILNLYHANSLQKYSVKHILEIGDTLALPLPQTWKSFFRNVNSPEALED
jgi:molybdenum cofactor guanylyltransferase